MLVSRHSVRSPLSYTPPAPLLTLRSAGWPSWPPPADVPGNLSAHGHEIAAALGAFYRGFYAAHGLLPRPGGCPPGGAVWIYADVTERTVQTADGLLEGMFRGDPAGCGAAVHRASGSVDALFKPLQAGAARLDPGTVQAEIRTLTGGPVASLAARFGGPLALMQRFIECCRPSACAAVGVPAPCALRDIPTRLAVDERTGAVTLRGGLALGGGFADDFLLQYAEGMPVRRCAASPGAPCVAWGAATPADLRAMLELYVLKQTVDNRPASAARAAASALMRQIAGALRQAASGTAQPGVVVPRAARFAAFVGHDTNLSNLGGALRMSWTTPAYPANTTPPASALLFELHRNAATGRFFVRTFFLTMTPDQLRTASSVGAPPPPDRVPVVAAGCTADCPLPQFLSAAAHGAP